MHSCSIALCLRAPRLLSPTFIKDVCPSFRAVVATIVCSLAAITSPHAAEQTSVRVVREVKGTATPLYIANRPPLEPSPFVKLPIGSIEPRGWLRHQLELERDGMIGRLKEISPWLNFEKSAWGNPRGEGER